MKITDIQQQKKNDERFSIFIDNEFKFGLSAVDVALFKLKIDDDISEERYNYILDNVIFGKARDKALKYLSFKSRTEYEVSKKLQEYDYSEEIIFRVLELLKRYNYVNDELFSKSYIKDRVHLKGYGKFKIKHELKERGVHEHIIEECLTDSPLNELENAIKYINKKNKNPSDQKERNRIYNALLRRGFSYEIIKQAFDNCYKQDSFLDDV